MYISPLQGLSYFGETSRRWSTASTQATPSTECQKPTPCDVCDGLGFCMVSAYGAQEIKCSECGGTGVKRAQATE